MISKPHGNQRKVFETIRDRITYGVYPPGMSLPENELCQEFGISRTPLREAILKLQDMKLVTVIPRYGTNVSAIDINDIRCAFELKVKLEGLAGELAGRRITSELLDRFGESIEEADRLARELDPDNHFRLLEIEADFHDVLRVASGNHVLKEYLETLHFRCGRLWSLGVAQSIPDRDIIDQMRQVHRALAGRDSALAKRLMEEHVRYFVEKIKEQLL